MVSSARTFERALELGRDALETDVHVTRVPRRARVGAAVMRHVPRAVDRASTVRITAARADSRTPYRTVRDQLRKPEIRIRSRRSTSRSNTPRHG